MCKEKTAEKSLLSFYCCPCYVLPDPLTKYVTSKFAQHPELRSHYPGFRERKVKTEGRWCEIPTIVNIMHVWIRDDPQATQAQKVPQLLAHSPLDLL